jgi:O-methyltransferase involved in polyketide biosynthesis
VTTGGIEAMFLETHNWGQAAKFFQSLGFGLEFSTDHNSGQLRHGDGPYVFIAEIPRTGSPSCRDSMAGEQTGAPDGTAVRVALWRAMHVQVDPPPHVLEDEIGLQLAAPDDSWRRRPDMNPEATSGYRAAIAARARFIEDLVSAQASESWWEQLAAAGFDPGQPAVVVSTGVTMYLSKDATAVTLRQIARLAPGSTLAMTFLLPPRLLDDADRAGLQVSEKGARASGTPFICFYSPAEMLTLAREAGFRDPRHVPGTSLAERYFAGRTDGLRPSSGDDFLVATTGGVMES